LKPGGKPREKRSGRRENMVENDCCGGKVFKNVMSENVVENVVETMETVSRKRE
jgi:hypothetical protein